MKWLGPSFLEGFIWAQIQRPSLYYSFICGLRLSSSRREAHFGSQRRNVHSASIQFAANFASRCLETSEPSAAKYLFPLNFYIFFAFFFLLNLHWIFTFYFFAFFMFFFLICDEFLHFIFILFFLFKHWIFTFLFGHFFLNLHWTFILFFGIFYYYYF